jgi:hypothetical protein
VSEHGNVFMREIAEHLVEALAGAGQSAELVVDRLPGDAPPLDQLVVAPHEFFGLFPAPEADRIAAAARSVCINTEQPGTPFFDLAMHYAAHGPGVLDISPFALDSIRRTGLPAVHLPLGHVASIDRWHGVDQVPREVDIAFLGGRTPRREAFLGGAAGQLWEWRTDLRLFSWHRPARDGTPSFTVGDDKYARLADTRILLNVHRDEAPYFEWARVVEAIANGCVIATETSVGIEPLVPGTHLLMAPLDTLAEQAVALAFDEPRRAAMAKAAYEVLVDELDQRVLVTGALDALAAEMKASRRSRPAISLPKPRPRRAAPAASPTGEQQFADHTAARLKQAVIAQMGTIRAIEASLAVARHGAVDHVDETTTPTFGAAEPEVTVVIPLYNQGHYLAAAIDSAIAASSRSPRCDIVVVDDHSTDDSLAVAHQLLAERAWFPIAVVARAANGGLPVARNTGFSRARGRYLFALDADNLVYPTGLAVLVEHLDRAPADVVAAYGLLERFDETGSLGLTSHLPWDVDLLVHGAYIDAMAMFRSDSWQRLGGYADVAGIYGWEDYDLWLTIAEAGQRADLVGRFVGRYREQAGSMRRISDIDMATNFVTLRERHPRLPWPS